MTDAAAFSRTSNLRPVMYTFAPFAAKVLVMLESSVNESTVSRK